MLPLHVVARSLESAWQRRPSRSGTIFVHFLNYSILPASLDLPAPEYEELRFDVARG